MPHTPFAAAARSNPQCLRIGNHIRFVDAPILAPFVPGGITGKIIARIGFRAYEIECDGHKLAVFDFAENLRLTNKTTPYVLPANFASRRKA